MSSSKRVLNFFGPQMKYRFTDCEVDLGTRVITRQARPVHVEPQVFDLIVHLMENRARIVDKDELIARVWKGRIVADATIAARINAARSALGDNGREQCVIATVSRQGFRFVATVSSEGDMRGRPAVAVMPLTLRADDLSDAYLARGLADQLASALGQAGWFDVRDTSASFSDTLKCLPPSEIARRLNVGHLVGGALEISGNMLRLRLRLIDPESESQVWTDEMTGTRDGIFELQDRMARRVLGQIEPRLRQLELQRSVDRHGNFNAFDQYLRAADILRGMDLAAMQTACGALDRAVREHPDYAAAHAMRAWIATLMLPQGVRVDAALERERSRRAVTLGRFDCEALAMGGYALGFFERDPLLGLSHLHRALALNPSSARAHDHAGWLLLYAGEASEAQKHFESALTLCPIDEFSFRMLTGRAFSLLFLGQFEVSAADARRALSVAPHYTVCHRVLAAALANGGRDVEARTVVRDLIKINPGLTLARYSRDTRFECPADRITLFYGLKRAGLP